MKRFLALALFACSFILAGGWALCQQPNPVIESIRGSNVLISTPTGEGSGTILKCGDELFVLTAAHVVADRRIEKPVIKDHLTVGTEVQFLPVMLIQELSRRGRKVGEITLLGEVIRYTPSQDLALLKVSTPAFQTRGVCFADPQPLPLGTELYHVGNLLGSTGVNSLTTGVMSYTDRFADGLLYDQASVTIESGSSGGGVFHKETGEYVGMVTAGYGQNMSLLIPLRRILAWAKTVDAEWVFHDSPPEPTLAK